MIKMGRFLLVGDVQINSETDEINYEGALVNILVAR